MSYYREQMTSLLTSRAGDWLRRTSYPRCFTAAWLVLAIGVGCYVALGVRAMGFGHRVVFLCAGCLAGYATFYCCESIWLWRQPPLSAKALTATTDLTRRTVEPAESEFDRKLAEVLEEGIRHAGRQGKDVFGLMVAIGVLGMLFVSIRLIYHAPWRMGQLLVEGGKIQHRALAAAGRWAVVQVPLANTWMIAVLLLMHFVAIGFAWEVIVARAQGR